MRKPIPIPSQEYLKQCFEYNRDTGKLTWKNRPVTHFSAGYRSAQGCCNNWNAKMAGKEAFTAVAKNGGYNFGTLDGVKGIKAHRLIWKLFYGVDPSHSEIDHANGIRTDNRIENLTLTTSSGNSANLGIYKASKTGVHGVRWNKATSSWRVVITRDKKTTHIGLFDDFFEACCARKGAELKLGFSSNHGQRSAHSHPRPRTFNVIPEPL